MDTLELHDHIRVVRIIFFALLGGQVLFFLVAYFLSSSFDENTELKEVFSYIIPLFLFSGIFLSRFLYRNHVSKTKTLPLLQKIVSYRTAVIISLAVLEGVNMLSIIAFMLTGEYLYAGASVILFLLFILGAPSEDRFRNDYELTPEELSRLD